jgi:hypothetical protein
VVVPSPIAPVPQQYGWLVRFRPLVCMAPAVYLAEDVRHHRRVAVKVLRAELAATLGVERFLHEIETAAQFQHPHILPLLDR